MSIKFGTKSITNFLFGDKQVVKILFGNIVLWENWKPWSKSGSSTAAIGWYGPSWPLSYTIPENTEVSYVSCTAGVYSHSGTATVSAQIYIDGTKVAESSTGVASEGNWGYKSVSYTPASNLPAGTVIKVVSSGTSYRRSVSYSLTGRYK